MKFRLIAAFGVGYVLGSRAGQERYEEIRRAAERVQADPRVQDAAQRAEAAVRDAAQRVQDDPRVTDITANARGTAKEAAGRATDKAKRARDEAKTRVKGEQDGSGSADDGEGEWPPHPDEHVEPPEDELVHSTGPDVEETIEELGTDEGQHRA